MRSSVGVPPDPLGSGEAHSNSNSNSNNNNNSSNNSSEVNGNSGSQYALCALGVGLVALGIVMIVWSVVPGDPVDNSSSSNPGAGNDGRKSKASSVAFILTGCGVAMLLLSLCLGMRNKQREQLQLREAQNHSRAATRELEEREIAEQEAQRYAVPTYEEAVGSGQYPVTQSSLRPSISQLPSYDDLVRVDGVQYENEGSEDTVTGSRPAVVSSGPSAAAAVFASNHRPGKTNRKLLPIKIRRIKSEKLHMKNTDNSQPAAGISVEPLTPPPQYEDKVPPL